MPNDMNANAKAIHVVQITDCHLKREPDGELLGMNTRDSFEAVYSLVRQSHVDADYVIASGDLAQDGSVEAYQYFKDRMEAISLPISWFPGNHDDRDNMAKVVGDGEELAKVKHVGAWQFILLDSLVPGSVHGRLGSQELDILRDTLAASPDKPTMICMHHHALKIDCQWLDGSNLKNSQDLLDIISSYSNVKVVLCGHIHQEMDVMHEGKRFLATPSTCIQFKPKSDDFAIDPLAPGYRWFKLYEDGSIETGVERATDFEFEIDMNSDGY